jgi:hypothetical protein
VASHSFPHSPYVPTRSRRGVWIVAAGVVVVTAALAIALVLTQSPHPEEPVAPSQAAGSSATIDAPAPSASIPAIDPAMISTAAPSEMRDAAASDAPADATVVFAQPDAAVVVAVPANQTVVKAPSYRAAVTRPKKYGKITVLVDPWADVYLDGTRIRSTPLLQHQLAAGTHDLMLVNPTINDGKKESRSIRR